MSTRILFWNIRDFAIDKIANPKSDRQKHTTIRQSEASQQRLAQILSVINNVDPQIFILVETETIYDGRGKLVRGAGLSGAIALLAQIKIKTGNQDWQLVPPVITGKNEGVAVYYRSTNRYFTGPNIWSGGAGGISSLPHTVFPLGYPDNLKTGLPARNIPGGAQYNGGLPERSAAARVEFTLAPPALAGTAAVFDDLRAPYMTTFSEVDNGNNVQRNLTIFSVHSPASRQPAIDYLESLANINEIVSQTANNEVRVIAGDFNINSMQTTKGNIPQPAYQKLIDNGFALTIAPTNNVPDPPKGYLGYFATHIKSPYKKINSPKPNLYGTTKDLKQFYPGFGYIGADSGTYIAIDNIYVKYGTPTAIPGTTILNTVVGSPLNIYDAPPHTPEGDIDLHWLMGDFYGENNADPPEIAPQYQAGVLTTFGSWDKYGRIYGVSDHFALAIDI
jgi:hypothetical protein